MLNHKGRLGIIYRGLTHFILAKHGGAKNIPRIKHQDCIRSPTTKTLFLIIKLGGTHLCSKIDNFPLKATPLEQMWCQLTTIQLLQIHPTQNLKLLHKLLLQNIYEIKHITLPNGINLISQQDFKNFYTKPTKLIKNKKKHWILQNNYFVTLDVIQIVKILVITIIHHAH